MATHGRVYGLVARRYAFSSWGWGEGGRIDARCENSERSPPEGARRVIAMRRDVGNATVDKFKDKGRLRRYPGEAAVRRYLTLSEADLWHRCYR